MAKSKRGFAAMDPKKARLIQSQGGKASPQNFKNRNKKMRKVIASMGGKISKRGKITRQCG